MMLRTKFALLACVFCLATAGAASAQQQSSMPGAMAGQQVTAQAKITAIDKANRVLTLKDSSGDTAQIQCGPEVKRFDELKVGQTVTFTYTQAVALQVVKYNPNAPTSSSSQTMTRATGANPGGTITEIQSKNVTITAIDTAKSTLTVKTPKGRLLTFDVKDKSNLTGLKVGDVVTVTYGQNLTISVK